MRNDRTQLEVVINISLHVMSSISRGDSAAELLHKGPLLSFVSFD